MSHSPTEMHFEDPDNPLRGLIIDDQRTMRGIVRQLLKQVGITHVDEARNGRHALEQLTAPDAKLPDFVICDLHMDEMDGIEFCNKIRLSKSDKLRMIPIIMLTGETDKFIRSVSRQVGAAHILSKPVTAEQLQESISDAIGFVV
ncbi:MAG: response regulator [Proteobacteria bacterium]|nr:response regulator [Pseudomonadota bacterium]